MKDKKEEILLAKLEDACQRNYEPRYFDFYDEATQMKIADRLRYMGEPYKFWGGMADAGRKMLCIYPEYIEDLQWPMGCLRFPITFELDHRNVLGALMGLGITRENLGDIHLDQEEVQIIFNKRMEIFLKQEFKTIKGRKIKPSFYSEEEIKAYEMTFKELTIVASSQRVDGMIGKIWGFSRQDALIYIKQGRLRVNYKEIMDNDFKVHPGDILSLRGKGKAKISEMPGTTKKGKMRIVVQKYV